MKFSNTLEFALECDGKDELNKYKNLFYFPQHNGNPVLYFTGNSLGLQPKSAASYVQTELEDWAKFGVEGHFDATNPWYSYHEPFAKPVAKLVGAKENEVVVMNGLTLNLHLLLISFYQPTPKRYKILCEAKAFPSDQYALESQVKLHGFDPSDAIIEISPKPGKNNIDHNDIDRIIKERGDEIALVMIGGVNYYTGQLMDMKRITSIAHVHGIICGFDLAHAAGNVPLELHNWGVDFAAWCSYKYLNSGPGNVAGLFIHQRHLDNKSLNRLAGWWGHNKESRFLMEKGFDPIPTAEGWQLSNAPVFGMAVHKASLDIFNEVGMEALRMKSVMLTGFLEFVILTISKEEDGVDLEIITPSNPDQRGSQISIFCHGQGKAMFDTLTENGVVADWREPNVIRMAPVPLYNSFEDVYRFGEILRKAIKQNK